MKSLRSLVLVACAAIATAGSANATLVTFEGLGNATIPNGYSGLNWSNIFTLDGGASPNSGYQNGVVSPTRVAYNAQAKPGSFGVSAGKFTFSDAYFTAAWNDGLQLKLVGLSAGSTLFSTILTLNTGGPTHFVANWGGIDTVQLSTFGGRHHVGLAGSGTHVAFDNLTFNATAAVPEPATWALIFGGFGLVGAALRRRAAVAV